MKKLILSGIVSISTLLAFAQNESDALRFSQTFPGGTARSVGMSGAFAGLGGDFSTLSSNPAGLGIYKGSEFLFTPKILNTQSRSSYLGNNYRDFTYRFGLNNLGYVYTYDYKRDEGFSSVSFGVGYNRLADFKEHTTIRTEKANGSLTDEFVKYANQTVVPNLLPAPKDELDKHYEYLAYNTYLMDIGIDTVINNADTNIYPFYFSEFNQYGIYGQLLEKAIIRNGGMGEMVFSIGANYSNQLYLGATISWQRLNFSQNTIHFENDVKDKTPVINSFTFKENLDAWGDGINLKLGAIYQPADMVRIGLAFHTPTYYYIETEFSTQLDANFSDAGLPANSNDKSEVTTNSYSLLTPMKTTAGVGLILGKTALIDIDYEYIDYRTMRIQGQNDTYADINENIQNFFKETHNIRAGFELRFNPFYLRGGYAYYDSPYTSSHDSKLSGTSYGSGGVGFREGNFSLDLGFSRALNQQRHYLFNDNFSIINYTRNQFLATIAFRF